VSTDSPNNLQNFSFPNLFSLPESDKYAHQRHKLRQIGIFYWACMIFVPFFISKHWIDYETTRFYPILIPLCVALACAPIIYRKTASYSFYSTYVVTLGIALVILLIAFAGGNRAPAAFWLVGTPLIFGLIYGSRGVWIGSSVMVVTFVSFLVLNHLQLLPNLVAEYGDYEREKLINLVGFGIYNIFTSYYFINTEEKAQKKLFAQKQETDTLLRILVHDVATPINAIQLVRYASKTGNRDPEEMLKLIDEMLAELSDIVQQVRKLRAIKDGKLKLDMTPVPIQLALADSVRLLQEQAAHKDVRLALQCDGESAYVMADEPLLKSTILANPISNGIKFSYPGQTIDIRLSVTPAWLVVRIADQGVGMPEHVVKHIFDPASPTSHPGTQGERGTGYGMPLAKVSAEKLGGDIAVVSSQEIGASGTTVTIRLPRSFL
jgi:signal transduction histidine kinase